MDSSPKEYVIGRLYSMNNIPTQRVVCCRRSDPIIRTELVRDPVKGPTFVKVEVPSYQFWFIMVDSLAEVVNSLTGDHPSFQEIPDNEQDVGGVIQVTLKAFKDKEENEKRIALLEAKKRSREYRIGDAAEAHQRLNKSLDEIARLDKEIEELTKLIW